MKQIIAIIVAIMLAVSCAPVTSPTPAEATVIYSDASITLYHLTYRGHELIVSSRGGVVELAGNPYDTYQEASE